MVLNQPPANPMMDSSILLPRHVWFQTCFSMFFPSELLGLVCGSVPITLTKGMMILYHIPIDFLYWCFRNWIGFRENLQESLDFFTKYGGFPVNVPNKINPMNARKPVSNLTNPTSHFPTSHQPPATSWPHGRPRRPPQAFSWWDVPAMNFLAMNGGCWWWQVSVCSFFFS